MGENIVFTASVLHGPYGLMSLIFLDVLVTTQSNQNSQSKVDCF